MFHSRALNGFDIERYLSQGNINERMNEDDVSKEIVKIERELTELRREQKNVQSKIQVPRLLFMEIVVI